MRLAPRRVLVTRPQPGASQTVRLLEELGFVAVTLPLREIHALPVSVEAARAAFAAVAVTSANAIRHAPRELLAGLAARPCFAVGESTGNVARAAGFIDVIEARGDAEALAETIVARRPDGPVAYLCGRVRRPHFEQRLARGGVAVTPIEIYDTTTIGRTTAEMSAALGETPIDYALVHSANAAGALVETMERPELRRLFKNTEFACISARVADALAGQVSGKILVAAEPSETALLTLLERMADNAP